MSYRFRIVLVVNVSYPIQYTLGDASMLNLTSTYLITMGCVLQFSGGLIPPRLYWKNLPRVLLCPKSTFHHPRNKLPKGLKIPIIVVFTKSYSEPASGSANCKKRVDGECGFCCKCSTSGLVLPALGTTMAIEQT